MKKYYVIKDNLGRLVAILHTDNDDAWLKYDLGGISVKTFVSRDRALVYAGVASKNDLITGVYDDPTIDV